MPHRLDLRARANQYFVYSGRSVLVTNLDGLVRGSGTEGFYAENTRLLSRLTLRTCGQPPSAVAVSPVGADRLLGYYEVPGSDAVPGKSVYLTVSHVVDSGLGLRVRVDNYSLDDKPCQFELIVELAADFADSQEAEERKRQQEAEVVAEVDHTRNELWFRYRHPKLDRAARVRVEKAPGSLTLAPDRITVPIELASHSWTELALELQPYFDGKPLVPDQAPVAPVRERLKREIPSLVTTNDVVARAWKTATEDLASMPLGQPSGPAAPMAGIPLYQQFFGRDTLTTAWQALPALPSMMRDALTANAAFEGRKIDDWFDEEPGKLIHQATLGPLAALDITNNRRNYGDYATAPDFLIMLGQYLSWTNDTTTVRKLLPTARHVVEWIERFGDLDGDGFIEYQTRSSKGIKNQGWKDADDAIVDEEGKITDPPIATSELQAYVYAGLQQAALAFAVVGRDYGSAGELLAKARALRKRINEAFWLPDRGFYAMALGPDKRPVRSMSSNDGHLLAAGVVPRSRAAQVARRLLGPDMFSGWGIRTLSADHPAYNPFSYHRGSVWPVEQGTTALGFARYGLWDELHRLAKGIFDLSDLFRERRLPESIGGLPRDDVHAHPGIYPASCEPQSWSASTVVMLLQALLGMQAIAPLRLLVVDPHLPEWLPDLRLTRLRVGGGLVDLDVRRKEDGTTTYRWHSTGGVRVVRQAPPQARVGPLGRVWTAVRSLV